jgi:hypothetical protein
MSFAPSSEHTSPYLSQVSQGSLTSSQLADLMQAVLGRGLPFRFRAAGHSMSPFIRDGDLITLAPFKNKPPALGEMVAFTLPPSQVLFVHRIIAQHNPNYLIQGDNNPCGPDGEIPLSTIIGRVIQIERSGKLIHFGLGPERLLIAYLSLHHLLIPMIQCKIRLKLWLNR